MPTFANASPMQRALQPARADRIQALAQQRRSGIDLESHDVDRGLAPAHGNLDPGHELQAHARSRGRRLFDAFDGVVVGEGQAFGAGADGQLDQRSRAEEPVGARRVVVEVVIAHVKSL